MGCQMIGSVGVALNAARQNSHAPQTEASIEFIIVGSIAIIALIIFYIWLARKK